MNVIITLYAGGMSKCLLIGVLIREYTIFKVRLKGRTFFVRFIAIYRRFIDAKRFVNITDIDDCRGSPINDGRSMVLSYLKRYLRTPFCLTFWYNDYERWSRNG